VPGAVAVDVEARITELVEAHRPELAFLVDRGGRRELARLVEERIAVRKGPLTNGKRSARSGGRGGRAHEGLHRRWPQPRARPLREGQEPLPGRRREASSQPQTSLATIVAKADTRRAAKRL
jgi:hypothetical protein